MKNGNNFLEPKNIFSWLIISSAPLNPHKAAYMNHPQSQFMIFTLVTFIQ